MSHPQLKNLAEVNRFFQGKRCLLLEPNQSIRSAQKKILLNHGVEHQNIFNAETVEVAEDILKNKRPEVVFIDLDFFAVACYEKVASLLHTHLKQSPQRLESAFFLIADKNHPDVGNLALESGVDDVLFLPFSSESFEKTICENSVEKIHPSPLCSVIMKAKEQIVLEDYSKAQVFIEEAKKIDKSSYLVFRIEAMLAYAKGSRAEAASFYEKAREVKSDDFETLYKLGKIYLEDKNYTKAYPLYVKMYQSFPFHTERFFQLIRLAIVNQRYDDVFSFCKPFKNDSSLLNGETKVFIAAGLAICGRQFFLDKAKAVIALDALDLAIKLSDGKIEIVKNVIQTLIKNKKPNEALDLIAKFKNDENVDPELLLLEFEALHDCSNEHTKILQLGYAVLGKNIKTVHLFQVMLERSQAAKRNKSAIDSLIQEANIAFPLESSLWDKYR